MSLTETNLLSVTKRQYLYKIKSHMGIFNNLAAAQLIVLLLTSGRSGMMGSGGDGLDLKVLYYSSSWVTIATLGALFYVSIIFAGQVYRNQDFAFVANRLSSNLSNIGFLLTAAVLGGITASLYGVLLRVILFYTRGSSNIIGESFFLTPQDLLSGMAAAVLYGILCSALGYLIGILINQHGKIFLLLIPALFIGTWYLQVVHMGEVSIFTKLILFFVRENSLAIFTFKALVTGAVLFATSIMISNRTEVRS